MRKIVLSLVLVFSMMVCSAAIVMADAGFRIGIGYEDLNNTLSASTPFLGLEINTPVNMYTVDLGYDFDDNFAINGKFAWGTTDIAKFNANLGFTSIEVPFTQDNQLWQVEAVYKAPVSDNFRIGGIIGYANSKTTTKGTFTGFGIVGSGQAIQSFDGAYLGALASFNPTNAFEIGASYRYLINPDGKIDASASAPGWSGYSHSFVLDDLHVSIFDVYAKAAITKNWSASAGYTYMWTDYTVNFGIPVDITNKTTGLWAKLEYKF